MFSPAAYLYRVALRHPRIRRMFEELVFIVQPYVAKPHRLVAQPARVFTEEAAAKRAGARMARFRAGVVVLAQSADAMGASRKRPHVLAIHGRIPEGWTTLAKAA
jgi:hypothetical protein